MFRIIHVKGMCAALYTVKCTVGGIFGGDMFRIIYLKGDMFCIILDIYIPDYLGQSIFHFIYLINLIGQE